MSATSVHALPCACRRLAFLFPTWQRPSSSKTASMSARSLFLLENCSLKFDLIGVGRRSKYDILQSRYQLGEFLHLYNDLRKGSTKFCEYCKMSPWTFDYIVQAIRQHIWLCSAGYTTAHFTHLNKFSENNIRGRKTVLWHWGKSNMLHIWTLYSVPWWREFGSLEDRYSHNDSNTLIK